MSFDLKLKLPLEDFLKTIFVLSKIYSVPPKRAQKGSLFDSLISVSSQVPTGCTSNLEQTGRK